MATITNNTLTLESAPAIPGLSFRNYRDESDLPAMLALINACKTADQEERHDTLENIINNYRHLTNCDPLQDVLIAEMNGEAVAYSRLTWWQEEDSKNRIYMSFGFIHPEWRRKGIGAAMLQYNQSRLRAIAAQHPVDGARFFESFCNTTQVGTQAILEKDGYQPVRHFYAMVRPDLENIPDLPLPEGLEVRLVPADRYRQMWDAFQEAFRDHWGYAEPKESDYEAWLKSPEFQPELWQVAWDDDQIAGFILNFINHGENEEYNRKRGWTECIGVRRPWRRRGLARALLARSLRMHRDLGMTEAALGVDTQSLSGANLLYESMGFRPVRVHVTYRKAL
jgi:GNAT superfamily N-acetyltransferase